MTEAFVCGLIIGLVIGTLLGVGLMTKPDQCPKCGGLLKQSKGSFAVCTRCPFFRWY